jgi:hypothetical protein
MSTTSQLLGLTFSGGTIVSIDGNEIVVITTHDYISTGYTGMINQTDACAESGYTDWYLPGSEGYPTWFFSQYMNQGTTGLAINYSSPDYNFDNYAIQRYEPLSNTCTYTYISQDVGYRFRPIRKITIQL